ncbi:MAG TPA: DUF3014 domain-containing protein [Woeseiaceae bacterium]|nr:DUF3014 domain-containing protein [Woeseiaceae bacterium]
MDNTEIKWLIALSLVAAAAVAAWFFWDGTKAPPVAPAAVEQQAPVTEPAEQLHPLEPLELTPAEGELVELPPLAESDSYFALALIDVFGAGLETLLADEALIDKTVATADNLTRDRIAEKIRPLGRLSGNFVVSAAGDTGPFYLSAGNYDRYKPLVNMLTDADPDAVVSTYRRFYPLFQEAYAQLGYPDAFFNDRVVAVIDHLLATPQPEEPIRLVQPNVLYEFADPRLEALSSGQKLLLRMGPENAARIKETLADLRMRIAQPAR